MTQLQKYGFEVSANKSCGRHGNLGDTGPSITGYQQDYECFSGVWMDADEFYEGYRPDETYGPCKCNPKHCENCQGTGWILIELDGETDVNNNCPDCEGTGWLGTPEHPDDRYVLIYKAV